VVLPDLLQLSVNDRFELVHHTAPHKNCLAQQELLCNRHVTKIMKMPGWQLNRLATWLEDSHKSMPRGGQGSACTTLPFDGGRACILPELGTAFCMLKTLACKLKLFVCCMQLCFPPCSSNKPRGTGQGG
jgi:hypothetical protein